MQRNDDARAGSRTPSRNTATASEAQGGALADALRRAGLGEKRKK